MERTSMVRRFEPHTRSLSDLLEALDKSHNSCCDGIRELRYGPSAVLATGTLMQAIRLLRIIQADVGEVEFSFVPKGGLVWASAVRSEEAPYV